jgi:hypothetical protein
MLEKKEGFQLVKNNTVTYLVLDPTRRARPSPRKKLHTSTEEQIDRAGATLFSAFCFRDATDA